MDRLLMRVHARMRRPQEAIHQFEARAAQVRHERGMSPAAETVTPHERICSR